MVAYNKVALSSHDKLMTQNLFFVKCNPKCSSHTHMNEAFYEKVNLNFK